MYLILSYNYLTFCSMKLIGIPMIETVGPPIKFFMTAVTLDDDKRCQ